MTHVARRAINRVTRRAFITWQDFDLLDRNLLKRILSPDLYGDGATEPASGYYPHLRGHESPMRHFLMAGWQRVALRKGPTKD